MVFLSYAKGDEAAVHRVYRELRYAGLQPWMDKPPGPWSLEGIGPGEDWDAAVRQRLAEAELLLIFLSKASIAKHGYVQREYRMALDLAATKPAGSVFLIPILLEDCEPPDLRVGQISLHQFQWYRLFEVGVSPLLRYIAGTLPASRPTSGGGRPRVTLQKTLIEMFSLEDLAPEKAEEMVNRLGKLVFQSVLVRVLPTLSEEQLSEYERIVDSNEDALRLFAFLQESVPDFDDIVLEEADVLRTELSDEFKQFGL
jgi:hypothetical protein